MKNNTTKNMYYDYNNDTWISDTGVKIPGNRFQLPTPSEVDNSEQEFQNWMDDNQHSLGYQQ